MEVQAQLRGRQKLYFTKGLNPTGFCLLYAAGKQAIACLRGGACCGCSRSGSHKPALIVEMCSAVGRQGTAGKAPRASGGDDMICSNKGSGLQNVSTQRSESILDAQSGLAGHDPHHSWQRDAAVAKATCGAEVRGRADMRLAYAAALY